MEIVSNAMVDPEVQRVEQRRDRIWKSLRLDDIHRGVSRVWDATSASSCAMSKESIAIISGDHGDTRWQTGVLVLWDIEALRGGVALGVVLRRVERVVSWPWHLRPIVIRSSEERLLVVGLVVLRIGVGHPVSIRWDVVELRARNRPFELMLRTCWRRIVRACCHRNILSTVVISHWCCLSILGLLISPSHHLLVHRALSTVPRRLIEADVCKKLFY